MKKSAAFLLLLAACSSDPAGPNGTEVPSGSYHVTTTIGGVGYMWNFNVVSADESRAIIDFTSGDVRGTLPVRDTAEVNVDAYRVQWLGIQSGVNYVLRFTSVSCSALIFPGINSTSCSITRP